MEPRIKVDVLNTLDRAIARAGHSFAAGERRTVTITASQLPELSAPYIHYEVIEDASANVEAYNPLADLHTPRFEGAETEADLLAGGLAQSVDATARAVELAVEHGVELSVVEGTGSEGRITADDVKHHVEARDTETVSPEGPGV